MTDTADKVRQAIALIEGGMSEQAACKEAGVARSTFRQAAVRYGDASYARACEALAQDQVEKIEQVIEDLRAGKIAADVARVELDARKWTASRLFRKTWGDGVKAELTGPNGGPIQHEVDLTNATPEQLDALEALFGRLAASRGNDAGDSGGTGAPGT